VVKIHLLLTFLFFPLRACRFLHSVKYCASPRPAAAARFRIKREFSKSSEAAAKSLTYSAHQGSPSKFGMAG
jgi:hypothetical protein